MSDDAGQKPDLAKLERIARANGYWHHIEPFAAELAQAQHDADLLSRFVDIEELREVAKHSGNPQSCETVRRIFPWLM